MRNSTINQDFGKVDSKRYDLVNLVIGAYRSIRMPIAYVSMPISSGKLMYDVLEKKGMKTLEELAKIDPDSVYNEIILPNVLMGVEAADKVRSNLPKIAPSVFEGKKFRWSQEEYMALWFRVIEERAREMYMTNGWQYSNGGVKEFTRAIEMQFGFINPIYNNLCLEKNQEKAYENMRKIKIYNLVNKELRINDGINMVGNAIIDLEKRGFACDVLKESFDILFNMTARFWIPKENLKEDKEELKKHLPYDFSPLKAYKVWEKVNSLK